MIRAEGIVVENKNKTSKVKIVRSSMCGDSCGNCNLCGKGETVVIAENSKGAEKGDRVVLEMEESSGIKACAMVYGIPLLIVIAGIVLISIFSFDQVTGLLVILAVNILYFALLKAFDKKMKPTVKITEVYNDGTK